MTNADLPPSDRSVPLENGFEPDGMKGQSHLIGRILAPALGVWLRSQVEQVDDLQVHIEAGDRHLLSGSIHRVAIAAQRIVYRGLHLSDLALSGGSIRVNLGQVLRGKPLRLLQPVPVWVSLTLQEPDLNASLASPLLADALTQFLKGVLLSALDLPGSPEEQQWQMKQMAIAPGTLTLMASLTTPQQTLPVIVRTGLKLAQGNQLQLDRPEYLVNLQAKRGLPLTDLQGYGVDLGSEVCLQDLILAERQLVCQGYVTVTPIP